MKQVLQISGGSSGFTSGSTVQGKFNLERVIETGETFTIPDEHCYILARYLSIEGAGVLALEGDATMQVI